MNQSEMKAHAEKARKLLRAQERLHAMQTRVRVGVTVFVASVGLVTMALDQPIVVTLADTLAAALVSHIGMRIWFNAWVEKQLEGVHGDE